MMKIDIVEKENTKKKKKVCKLTNFKKVHIVKWKD